MKDEQQQKQFNVFISYSRKDLEVVKSIKEELGANGFSCWMDLEGIESGSPEFTKTIAKAINDSLAVLFFLSDNSQMSRWSLNELRVARDNNKRVVLVRFNHDRMSDEFKLEFGGADVIDWRIPEQKGKLLRDLNNWVSQCSAHYSMGAVYENDEAAKVWAALRDPEKICLVHIAPAVRVAVGEAFDMKPGELTTGKIYAALRMLGFDKVFDTNFSADVMIMEEDTEFIKRFIEQKDLPLITSCCPACMDWMEKNALDFTGNFSTVKSPQQMLSALCKSYWAEKNSVDHTKVHVTSIMPCTTKKYEISRDEYMSATGPQDTDVVLTTSELARMIKVADIDFASLPEEPADKLLGAYTGAGTIFGVTGGVMEAALRSAYCLMTGEAQPPSIDIQEVRGMKGVKTATIDIKGTKVNIAVAHQMDNVKKVLDMIREDRKKGVKPRFDFIEVMACRGGCIGGGGQPCLATDEVRAQRTAGLYTDDEKCMLRMSHLNPEVEALYRDYLDGKTAAQGGKVAHHLLHTKHKKDVR